MTDDTPNPADAFHDVGAPDDFVEGELVTFEIEGRDVGVVRVADELHAVSIRCTHAAWVMKDVPLEGCEILCSMHGARFDVRDGTPTGGPARRPLDRYPVRIRGERVEVRVSARRRPKNDLA